MKKSIIVAILIMGYSCTEAQTTQVGIGSPAIVEYINETKFDASDGSTISVGATGTSGVGNGTDCFIVKLDAAKQVVWQKTIANAGNDYFTRVIRCANGEYLAAGVLFRAGKQRGYICRLSSAGVLLWSVSSQNSASANGDFFADIYEMSGGNIAAVGAVNIGGGTANGLVVVLNSSGTQLWGRTVNFSTTDELLTVSQLPSGNLVVAGTLYMTNRYKAFVVEMNPTTAAIVSQNEYHISSSVTGINTNINTIWPLNSAVIGGNFYFAAVNCTGFTPTVNNPISINVYNPSTKAVTAMLFYHSGMATASGFHVAINAANDYFTSLSYGSNQAFISRVTSGSVAFSRKLDNTSVGLVHRSNISGTNIYMSGNTQSNDAYLGFSTTSVPLSSTPCNITTASTLQVISPLITRTANSTGFVAANSIMTSAAVTLSNTTGVITNICGLIPCIQKIVLQPY